MPLIRQSVVSALLFAAFASAAPSFVVGVDPALPVAADSRSTLPPDARAADPAMPEAGRPPTDAWLLAWDRSAGFAAAAGDAPAREVFAAVAPAAPDPVAVPLPPAFAAAVLTAAYAVNRTRRR